MKKLLSIAMCLCLILSTFTFVGIIASAETYGGTCGANLTWSLDTSTGVLEITGSGAMANHMDSGAPWYSKSNYIRTATIGDSVTSIGNFAFYNCESLTSVTIGDSVTSISDYAFYNCSSLTSVTIPNSVTSIGYRAFYDCRSLTSITIPNSVTSIGRYAFKDCSSLTSVTIPDSVTSIGGSAFYNTGYYNNEANWEDDVLYIGNHLIEAKETLSGDYTIKDGTKTIANSAFSYCDALTSVTIPDGVTSIDKDAFYNCSKLTSVSIGDSVTSIGDYAFYDCYSLTSVTIGDNVTSIGNYAFDNCSSLTSVNITDIKAWCEIGFNGYSSNPLYYAKKLYLNGELIEGDLVIPNGTTKIGVYAFYYQNISSITIPVSVTSICSSAFRYCDSLTSITVDSNNKNYCSENGVLFNKDKTILIQYPAKSEKIKYIVPNTVETIESYAFYNSLSLTSVSIPKSTTSIGSYAFGGCRWIAYVYYDGNTVWWERISIGSGNDYLTSAFLNFNHVHSYSSDIIKQANCKNDGEEIYTCACGHSYSKAVSAFGHTEITDIAVAPTCTATGLTEGKHCSVCNEVLVAQEVVEALGHTEGEWEFGENGLKVKECTVCDEVLESEEIFYGDCNDDKKIDIKDLLLLRKHLAQLNDNINVFNADCNADNIVNIQDVLELRKYLVKDINILGVK